MTKPDYSFYHFINFLFTVLICWVTLHIFMQGDRIDNFGRFLQFVSPLAIVLVGYWLFKKLRNPKFKGRENKQKFQEIMVYLSYTDLLKMRLILLLAPATVLVIPLLLEGQLYFSDLLQATATFLIFLFWQKWLLNKN